MSTSQPPVLRTYVVAAACAVAAVALALGVTVASGLYDMGADAPHTQPVAFLIGQLRDRSIALHARDVMVPNLDNPAMVAEGAEHYAAMCSGCHLAPGVTESEIRPGLYPEPPNLVADGIDDPKEAFWVVKHGIKMSGMPAWGRTHDDEAIGNVVAFLRKLKGMTPETYRGLAGGNAEEEEAAPNSRDEDLGPKALPSPHRPHKS